MIERATLYLLGMSEGTKSDDTAIDPVVDEHGNLLPHLRHDYDGRCWWCGELADSREHKHKKREVSRQFGSGPYRGDNAVIRGSFGEPRQFIVQGPNSDQLKFTKVLCATCNSSRSQKADQAFDELSDYIAEHDERLLRARRFRWSDVFPQRNWRDGRNLVTAYWLKHIGCRLAEGGIEVPPEFGAYLDAPLSDLRPVPVRMELTICENVANVHQALPAEDRGSFWLGDLASSYSRSQGRATEAGSFWGQGWLFLRYHYNVAQQPGSANFWRKKVRLPRRSYW